MSWTNELLEVYNNAVKIKAEPNKPKLLPISHTMVKANIHITLTEDGELDNTGIKEITSEDDENTIIPDTGKAKTGIYPPPYPLNESLRYLAGDFNEYISDNIKSNERNHQDYIEQLKDWKDSEYSHPALNAIYTYITKNTLIYDCICNNVLLLDDKTGKLKEKQLGVSVDKCFVRFSVQYADMQHEPRTWKDETLYNSFIDYLNSNAVEKRLCYATGDYLPITYTHPYGIVKSNARAKLISSNDDKNYTYRGRFSTKEEAFAVSYDYSQKVHNALKWLIGRQSFSFDSLTLVVWNSALDFVPNITENVWGDVEIEEYSSKPIFSEMLRKNILGGKAEFDPNSKVMVMGLDAATTGRLSISMYTELAESEFAKYLEFWHTSTAWKRKKYIKDKYEYILDSCSLPQIANCLYGTEQNGRLECDKKVLGDTILRLLPCVTERRKLPRDIVQTICNKASNPLAFDKEYNHMMIVENACALIRKEYSDYNKGEIKMAYDPTCTDRSYLFGCLLAIADKAERDTYEKDEKRITNARRYWNAFSSRPYQTWQIIEEKIEPYLEKDPRLMTKYTKHINDIMAKMSPDTFKDNSKLSPLYLIGFHHYNTLLWKGSEDNNKEE
ncbi:type I-C CRISPR-associated protein Cas8c/Csd1 [Ruminococcus albus]|uniref:CRISPR-associated protein, Csd1 family n=1 Tax=Ruminococcus albus (strain ATCC 27210 / DSM 20455 / JCM 14654 / NCDO 2250 / 7) TaxID=697329 RepID=E6UD51_RUMA7|nr:type I-C CRISPR-associated protein Cas8c/Csd1 [Ruminococcus albus]ADU21656.1 CRISPR-associated protein, Csd1 family [Ruminococcus albus 7 = DSM 20455]